MKTFVKICGLTTIEDARVAVKAGADLLGFILYPKSPRYVSPRQIAQITTELQHEPAFHNRSIPIQTVGVFVNEDEKDISQALHMAGLDLAQLHGDEPSSMLRTFAGRSYKAMRPVDAKEARNQAKAYALASLTPATENRVPRWLLDAYEPGIYGGTGKRADWHNAAELAQEFPGLLLAGGLTAANVAKAIQSVQPWGVDVASGVELEPGKKNHQAVYDFVRAAKS